MLYPPQRCLFILGWNTCQENDVSNFYFLIIYDLSLWANVFAFSSMASVSGKETSYPIIANSTIYQYYCCHCRIATETCESIWHSFIHSFTHLPDGITERLLGARLGDGGRLQALHLQSSQTKQGERPVYRSCNPLGPVVWWWYTRDVVGAPRKGSGPSWWVFGQGKLYKQVTLE